ncbi:hypothetical protein V8G54_025997 [Vigna mungo]|uniref:Uncharacterized protein n=1 Tax=Vigna mungo TaxID=3915 RepID=A0AAQ3RP20_VIGMU
MTSEILSTDVHINIGSRYPPKGECCTMLPKEWIKTTLKHNTKKANFNQLNDKIIDKKTKESLNGKHKKNHAPGMKREKGEDEDNDVMRKYNAMPEEIKSRGAQGSKRRGEAEKKEKR